MLRFVLMRHNTGKVVTSGLHYKYPHTAFFRARDYVVHELRGRTMQPNEQLSLGIENEKGELLDVAAFVRTFPASAMLKAGTYKKLISSS